MQTKFNLKLGKRTILSAILIVILIPATILFGIFFLDDRKYYIVSMLIILYTMLPFFFVFEHRKPQARELVIIAFLSAIAVAGRIIFFMVPQFKPLAAIVIISAVGFGPETGFLVGAVSAFVSNFYFGQGPYTPWQMFALGIIGFLAGVLFEKGLVKVNRFSLCLYGGLSTFIIYGLIMNTSTVFTSMGTMNVSAFLTTFTFGIPFDAIHAASTVLFLLLIGKPVIEKLERIKTKYGLISAEES